MNPLAWKRHRIVKRTTKAEPRTNWEPVRALVSMVLILLLIVSFSLQAREDNQRANERYSELAKVCIDSSIESSQRLVQVIDNVIKSVLPKREIATEPNYRIQ